MKKMQAYYYTVATGLPSMQFVYLKANDKKQIRNYLSQSHIQFIKIYDPVENPTEGVKYIDVTP